MRGNSIEEKIYVVEFFLVSKYLKLVKYVTKVLAIHLIRMYLSLSLSLSFYLSFSLSLYECLPSVSLNMHIRVCILRIKIPRKSAPPDLFYEKIVRCRDVEWNSISTSGFRRHEYRGRLSRFSMLRVHNLDFLSFLSSFAFFPLRTWTEHLLRYRFNGGIS